MINKANNPMRRLGIDPTWPFTPYASYRPPEGYPEIPGKITSYEGDPPRTTPQTVERQNLL